jgi:hypothetical protein
MNKFTLNLIFFSILAIIFVSKPAQAVQDGEYRLGVLAGNLQLLGKQAKMGSGLAYGLNFGYMFSDDMLFNIDAVAGTVGKTFTQTQLDVGVSYYFAHHNTAYYNLSGGMAVANNTLKFDAESLKAGSSGFYLGLGLDFDLGSRFVGGFHIRHNALTQVKRTTEVGAVETVVVDSFTTTLLKLAFVF